MQEHYIQTPEQLDELCRQLKESAWLALDTEFIREKNYYPKLCLVQVSNGELAAAVDVVALESWDPLLDLLYDSDAVKVFHAARQDLEIFQQLRGALPEPLFDTQPAAALLGYGEQVGYGDLVQKELGVELSKGHGRTDWLRRPLSEQQIRYALDDVIYLGDLYVQLRHKLESQGRLEWLSDEFRVLADPASYVVEPMDAWRKVKGRNRLRGQQLAVLQQLAAWREEQAQLRDRPRKWVLKDDVMVDLARRMPQQVADLASLRGLEPSLLERHGAVLLDLVRRGRETPKGQWPREKGMPPRLSENQQAQVELLGAVLHLEAQRNAVNPAAIAGRKDLERLVGGDEGCTLLKGWRRGLVGKTLIDVLEGRIVVAVEAGRMVLREPGVDA